MRREIDRYFSQYLASHKLTKDMINNEDTTVIELEDSLIDSIMNKNKKVFTSCIYAFDSFFKSMPVENSYTIVTFKRNPKCILKTTKVETIKFKDISSQNIEIDLKGADIDSWKKSHIGIFEKECREAFRVFNPNVPIVIETFELVYA
jgi:uncharacterized protein YhfF